MILCSAMQHGVAARVEPAFIAIGGAAAFYAVAASLAHGHATHNSDKVQPR